MSSFATLEDLLLEELRDLYGTEKELARILPKMAASADHPVLQRLFRDRLEDTKARAYRIEEAFQKLRGHLRRRPSRTIAGLFAEAHAAVRAPGFESIRDARLISATQRICHHEMAANGTARTLAQALGEYAISNFLQHSIDDAAEIDRRLTTLSAILFQEFNAARTMSPARHPDLGPLRASPV
ncbi:MAG: hypothetical protein JWM88_279 [Verrucomicrobia bacterium]|nr:hypothetical protein [Verrucomicrobiota bacterium]